MTIRFTVEASGFAPGRCVVVPRLAGGPADPEGPLGLHPEVECRDGVLMTEKGTL